MSWATLIHMEHSNGEPQRTGRDVLSCEAARVLVSAAADDEVGAVEREVIDMHLIACPACSAYADRVASLTRQFRLRPAEPVPDVAARVLERSRPPRLGRGGWLRPALAWVAVVIAAQSVGPLVFGQADGAATHVARHLGAFGAALGIGLLYAAWKPHRAFGLLPFAVALVVAMSVGATLDVVSGTSTFASEALHLTELAGLALLWMIAGSPGLDRLRGRLGVRLGHRMTARPNG